MKLKLLICLVLGICYTQLSAQPEKGDVLLGTQFSYYQDKTNTNTDYSEYTLLPTIGFYASPYFNIGFGVSFFGFNEEVETTAQNGRPASEEIKYRLNTYSIIANAHSKISERLFFNTNISLGYGKGSVDYFTDFTTEINQIELGVRPGLIYFTNSSIALTAQIAQLSYSMGEEKIDESNGLQFTQNTISNDGLRVGLGLEYIQFGILFLLD